MTSVTATRKPQASTASPRGRDALLTVEEAVRQVRAGRMIIVVDDADRENEGDIVFAAERATPAMVNFAVKHCRGILCAPMAPEIADRLSLKLLVSDNTSKFGTPFTESVDAKRGTTTGTSAFDRARTLRALARPQAVATDFVRPGHVFPLRAMPGGVLRRAGHTEAAPDLCRLAGLQPVAAVCEIMDEDGRMMRLPALKLFAKRHGLGILTIRDLIEWRRKREHLVRPLLQVPLPTPEGEFQLHLYESVLEGDHHIALVKGRISPVALREQLERRQAHHAAVLVHDLAHGGHGRQAGEPAEVRRRLGVTGAPQHAARDRAQREHVPRPHEVGAHGLRPRQRAQRLRAVERRRAGRRAALRVHGFRERRAELGRVVGNEQLEAEVVRDLRRHRRAQDAAAVLDREVHHLGRGVLGGEHDVALVLPVGVVDDDDHAPGAHAAERLLDREQRRARCGASARGTRPRGRV